MDQSQLAVKRLETTARNLAEDARAVNQTGRPKHHQALKILKQDYVLMNTIQLTSHYYYLLKKGNSASHFVPIAINEMGGHHLHN